MKQWIWTVIFKLKLMYVCMYVCMHVCVYVHVHVCSMYAQWTQIPTIITVDWSLFKWSPLYVQLYMYVYIHELYVCMCVCMYYSNLSVTRSSMCVYIMCVCVHNYV